MELTNIHIVGFILSIATIVVVGIFSGKFVKTGRDFFSGGSRATTLMVSGTYLGTMVGGASTVGTAQLAFLYGFSSLWFTFGSAIGALIMAFIYTKPLRRSGQSTY